MPKLRYLAASVNWRLGFECSMLLSCAVVPGWCKAVVRAQLVVRD